MILGGSDPARDAIPNRLLPLGCAGGMALAAAGSWLRFALAHTPRIDTHGLPFLLASAISGAGLVLSGLCALRLAPQAHRFSWRALWGWGLAVQVCGFLALALTSSDVFIYLCLGALRLAGLSPDTTPPAALGHSPLLAPVLGEIWVDEPSPYGPLFHSIAAAAAWIGEKAGSPMWGSFWAFKAAMLVAVLVALLAAARHLAATKPTVAAEIFVFLALGPFVAWEVQGQGHNDGLLFLSLIAFLAAAAKGRDALAAVALAAGVVVKCALAPLLVLYVILVARTSWRRAAVLGVLSVVVIGVALATEWPSVSLRALLPLLGGNATRHAHSLADLVCLVLDRAGFPAASAAAYRLIATGSLLVCAALFSWTAVQARSLVELARGYLLLLFAVYLSAPWFQPWYVTWALPLLIVEPDPRWRRFVAVFMVITVAQWAAPLDPVTTVIGDLWAANHLWFLLRPAGVSSDASEVASQQLPEPS